MADEVVAGGEGGRDGGFPVEVLEDEGGAPVAAGEGGCGHALLVDLCTWSAFLSLLLLVVLLRFCFLFLWVGRGEGGREGGEKRMSLP